MDPNQPGAMTFPGQPSTPAPTQPSAPQPVRQIADNVRLTDLNDESVKKYEFELYSGEANQIDRLYAVSIGDIVTARVHYHDKLKGGVLCQSVYTLNAQRTQETLAEERFCCRRLDPATPRFAVLVLKYNTDRQGNPVQPFGFEQRLWKFGADKFDQLRNINRDWPLTKHDISVHCTDKQYQKMQIGAKPDCYFTMQGFPDALRQQVLAWAKASVPKLAKELGRTYTEPELLQAMQTAGILTGAGPVPNMLQPTDSPVSNFADVLGGMGGGNILPGTIVPNQS